MFLLRAWRTNGEAIGTGGPTALFGLSFQTGEVVSLMQTNWSLFASYAVVDRGDWDRPATQLPILDGGFDQQQAVFGVEYAFVSEPPPERPLGI